MELERLKGVYEMSGLERVILWLGRNPWIIWMVMGGSITVLLEELMDSIRQRITRKKEAVALARWLRGHHGPDRWTEITPPK